MTGSSLATLAQLAKAGILAPLDVHVAAELGRLVPDAAPPVLLGAALASAYTREGHVCVDLERLAARPLANQDGEPSGGMLPPAESWCDELARSPLVGQGDAPTPLVLDARGRLYLRRYWQHEQRLAEQLRARVGHCEERFDRATARGSLARLFGPVSEGTTDWQRVAVQVALLTRFTVVSGGPGTGKTSTVVKLVAMLIEQALARGEAAPRVLLLAPTGKAAARLVESIRAAKGRLDCSDAVRAGIVEEASTIHRALGVATGSRIRVRHDADHPLPADVVIVDEASMVDVALMRRLVQAVPERARLVLLGDRDQLASVEAGAVLGDICGDAAPAYSGALRERARDVFGEDLPSPELVGPGGMGDHIVQLVHSHRFGARSGIGSLARAIQRGDADAVVALLHAPSREDVALVPRSATGGVAGTLRRAVVEGFRPFLRAKTELDALGLLECYRVLAAHRRGGAGIESLNQQIERLLTRAGLLPNGAGQSRRWYGGRPVLVTQNDYALRLFNGDIGVVWAAPGGASERACFPGVGASLREIAPARLPPHETAFAMSVHKSQGSELDEVAVVLPEARSPLLTRELLYTAVTRARRRVVLYGTEAAVRAAVARRVERSTSLRELIWR